MMKKENIVSQSKGDVVFNDILIKSSAGTDFFLRLQNFIHCNSIQRNKINFIFLKCQLTNSLHQKCLFYVRKKNRDLNARNMIKQKKKNWKGGG